MRRDFEASPACLVTIEKDPLDTTNRLQLTQRNGAGREVPDRDRQALSRPFLDYSSGLSLPSLGWGIRGYYMNYAH